MGKDSTRRPSPLTKEEWAANYDRTFSHQRESDRLMQKGEVWRAAAARILEDREDKRADREAG